VLENVMGGSFIGNSKSEALFL